MRHPAIQLETPTLFYMSNILNWTDRTTELQFKYIATIYTWYPVRILNDDHKQQQQHIQFQGHRLNKSNMMIKSFQHRNLLLIEKKQKIKQRFRTNLENLVKNYLPQWQNLSFHLELWDLVLKTILLNMVQNLLVIDLVRKILSKFGFIHILSLN